MKTFRLPGRMRRRGPSEFSMVYNLRDEESKGRVLLLLNTILVNILNVAITGAFYTTFLAANGIDIVQVGIISFIPYLAIAAV